MRPRGLFTEDFDHPSSSSQMAVDAAPDRAADAAPDDVPDMVPLAEHNRKCVRAWAEGQQAGVAAARADQGAKALAALAHLDQALDAMRAEWLDEARATAEALAALICTGFAAAFPVLCAQHGAAEVNAIVAEILPELAHEPEVSVRVAPDCAAAVAKLIDGAQGAESRVRVIGDPTMPDGDLRLEWLRGEARRDARDIWARIEAVLAPQGLLGAHEPAAVREKEAANVD